MAGGCRRFRFYGVLRRRSMPRPLLGSLALENIGAQGVDLIQVILQALLAVGSQSREFHPIAHARIAGSNHSRGGNLFLLNPELDPQHRSQLQGENGFYVATITADVGGVHAHRRLHALVAQFQRKRDAMTSKAAAIVGLGRRRELLGREFAFPRTVLVGDDLHPGLDLLDWAAIHYPDDPAPRLSVAILHADDVANFEFVIEPGEESSGRADVARMDVLGKRLSTGSHAPDAYRQIGLDARVRSLFAHGFAFLAARPA